MAIETSFTIKQLNADEALKQAEEKAKKTSENIDKSLAGKKVKVDASGLKSAEKAASGFGSKMKESFGSLAGMLGIVGIAGTIVKLKSYMTGLVTSTDMLSKSARNLGITGEDLQNLQYAARSAGMEVDILPSAFARMKKAAGNALNGDQGAIEQFQRLGISVKDLSGKKPWEIFEMVAESLNSIQNPAEKSAAGMDIFGRSFDKMQNFLLGYKDSIDAIRGRGIITDDHLQAAEKLTQEIENLQTALNALAVNSGFIESLHEMVAGLSDWVGYVNQIKKSGVVTREQAVSEAIGKAASSGKYTQKEIEEAKKQAENYSAGRGIFGIIGKALLPGYQMVESDFSARGTWQSIKDIFNSSNNIFDSSSLQSKQASTMRYKNGYDILDKMLIDANPDYKNLGRDANGNFIGIGQITTSISREQSDVEKKKRENDENTKKQRVSDRTRVMEEYRQNQIKKISGSATEAEANKQKNLDETAKKMKDAAAYDQLKTTVEQIDFKQKQITEEQAKQAEIQKKINDLKSKQYAAGEDVKKAEDLASVAKLETEIKESKNDQLKIELEIDSLRRKGIEYYKDAKYKLDADLAVQKKINEGKFEEAERQKIINDLKAKGLTVDEKEIDAMMKRKKELAALKFDDSMKQSGYDLLYQQQKKSNYRQAEYDKRVRDKERELGGPLNDAQKSKIYDMLDMEIKMNMEPKLDFRNTDIKTNELTARGGFSTGAVVVSKDRINEQIRGYAARQVSLLTQIKAMLGQEGII